MVFSFSLKLALSIRTSNSSSSSKLALGVGTAKYSVLNAKKGSPSSVMIGVAFSLVSKRIDSLLCPLICFFRSLKSVGFLLTSVFLMYLGRASRVSVVSMMTSGIYPHVLAVPLVVFRRSFSNGLFTNGRISSVFSNWAFIVKNNTLSVVVSGAKKNNRSLVKLSLMPLSLKACLSKVEKALMLFKKSLALSLARDTNSLMISGAKAMVLFSSVMAWFLMMSLISCALTLLSRICRGVTSVFM